MYSFTEREAVAQFVVAAAELETLSLSKLVTMIIIMMEESEK